jgi:membrane fusion protein (multidrug efflux system)
MNAGRLTLIVIFLLLAGATAWLVLGEKQTAERDRGPRSVSVVTVPASERAFTDIVEALGTARARESVTLTPRVSDTIRDVNFEDGQIVEKGHVLVVLEDDEERALVRETEANFREAERAYKRIENLVEQGNASPAALDTERRRLDEARFRVDAAQARLADQQIKAPFNGLLGLRQVSEGSLISPTTAITTIDAIDTIKLDFTVPERFIATLAPGQKVEAKVSAYPGRIFQGTVSTIDSRVDPITRSVLVRAEIPNKDSALRPGLLMTVQVINRTWQAIGIPEEAVVPTGGKDYVFIVDGDEAVRREVELGLRRPGYVEVKSGVSAGERVVIQGTIRLGRAGMKVIDMAKDTQVAGDAS